MKRDAVLVLGAFDALHWGHLVFLSEAARYGDVTVGVSSDELILQTKGSKPLFGLSERMAALERCGYRTNVRSSGDATELFRLLQPDFFVCGNDWLQPYVGHLESAGLTVSFLNEMGTRVVYVPRDHEMSTSSIVQRARHGR